MRTLREIQTTLIGEQSLVDGWAPVAGSDILNYSWAGGGGGSRSKP